MLRGTSRDGGAAVSGVRACTPRTGPPREWRVRARSQALSQAQLAAMVGATPTGNAKLVLVAALAAKNLVDGDRAATLWL